MMLRPLLRRSCMPAFAIHLRPQSVIPEKTTIRHPRRF